MARESKILDHQMFFSGISFNDFYSFWYSFMTLKNDDEPKNEPNQRTK